MRLGMQRFRSAQLHASAASGFVEAAWRALSLLFRLLLKDLENAPKLADFRTSTKFDSGRKAKIWHGSSLRNDLKCLSFLCGVGGTRSLEVGLLRVS